MKDNLQIIHNNRLFQFSNIGLFEGYIAVGTVTADTPTISFRGTPMPFTLWQQIVSFLQWTYDTYRAEGIVRLYYCETTGEWEARVHPQQMRGGLSVQDEIDVESDAIWRAFQREHGRSFELAGTVHHHCEAAAFQSATDLQDEQSTSGLHVTLGQMNAERYDIHARVSCRGHFYEARLFEWISEPEYCLALPDALRKAVLPLALTQKRNPTADVAFPEEWKKNCTAPVAGLTGFYDSNMSINQKKSSYQEKGRYRGPYTTDEHWPNKEWPDKEWQEEDAVAHDEVYPGNTYSVFHYSQIGNYELSQALLECSHQISDVSELLQSLMPESDQKQHTVISAATEMLNAVRFKLTICENNIG